MGVIHMLWIRGVTERDGKRNELIYLLTIIFLTAVPALAFDANTLDQGGSLPLEQSRWVHRPVGRTQEGGRGAARRREKDGGRDYLRRQPKPMDLSWWNVGGAYTCKYPGKWLLKDQK
jgi:hypothetical protein